MGESEPSIQWMLAVRRVGACSWSASALERAGKRSSALLHLSERGKALPFEARLAANRFPTRCILNYQVDGVLVLA